MAAVASIQPSYVWEDPGDLMMIQVSLDLIERLGAIMRDALGEGPRGVEVGGVLLGKQLPGFGRAILVEDFEIAPSEHLRGASYTLSPRDRRLLGARLTRRRNSQVVGYFRSHTRPGMYLDQDDFSVFSQYFPEPWQVFLLVSPPKEGSATGGFFFWEDGDINRRSPYRTFPFDSGRIAVGDYPVTVEKAAGAVTLAPAPAPVLVPKPLARASRALPPLPWVVVPVIAVLFLIAGLFVSENPKAVPAIAVKSSPPAEALLPEPVTPVAPVPTENAEAPAPAIVSESAPEPQPVTIATPKATKKLRPAIATPRPAVAAGMPSREVEPPPALAIPAARLEPSSIAVLAAKTAPVSQADVTYETPRPGVLRRALRKLEGNELSAFSPPSPVRTVSPTMPANLVAEALPVDVKVFIDESGAVSKAQVLTKGNSLAAAALNAARQWQFTPARKHDKPVPSEMVLHFRFGGA